MRNSTLLHLADIDFRTREKRQADKLTTYLEWYSHLSQNPAIGYDERLQGQLTMLSSVLWHELPKAEYKKLMKISKPKIDQQKTTGLVV